MNKVVREHYPAAMLPKELREGIDPGATVTITVETETHREKILSLEEMFALRRDVFLSAREIDEYVSAMRDEWSR